MASTEDTEPTIVVKLSQLQQLRDALETAQWRLDSLSKHDQPSTKAELAPHVSRAELTHGLVGLKEMTSTAEMVTTETIAALSRVLGTPELLEMIFQSLHPLDLLRAAQSCRAPDALQPSSKRMREVMCHEAARGCEDYWPFDKRDDVRFSTCTKSVTFGDSREDWAIATFAHLSELPRFGKHVRAMLIHLPPIQEATVRLNCCGNSAFTRRMLRDDIPPLASNNATANSWTQLFAPPGKFGAPQELLSATFSTHHRSFARFIDSARMQRMTCWVMTATFK